MARGLEETEFWNMLMRDIYGPREGGVIIVIDAENARKGVAKTSAGVALADRLAWEFGYDLTEEDGMLSGGELMNQYHRHPGKGQPSVLMWDEAVGGGSGDSRRAMSSENVKLGRAWQILRSKRIITITTLPNWGELDSRLQKFADYRLWCREWPIGEFQAYKVGTTFNGDSVTTESLDRDSRSGAAPIGFPDASSDFPHVGDPEDDAHPLYRSLSERKDALTEQEDFDAASLPDGNEEDPAIDPDLRESLESDARRDEAVKTVIRACQPWSDDGLSYSKASRLVDYSREWVGNRVREWRDEHKHRDLVEDPRAAQ